MYVFTLEGIPVAQKRVRFTRNVYKPNALEKELAQWCFKEQFKDSILKGEPLSVDITYYLPFPKTMSKKEKEKRLNNCLRHFIRPDIDNLLKFTLDAMQGIIFENDSQITEIYASKYYSETPRTVITIREIYASEKI